MQLYEPSHGSRAKYDAFIRVWENEITCACMHASGWGLQVIKTVCPLWICKEHVPVELESQNREVCLACLRSKNQTSAHTRLTPCTTGHLRGETSKRATAEWWDQPLLFIFSCFCIRSVCVCVCAQVRLCVSWPQTANLSSSRSLSYSTFPLNTANSVCDCVKWSRGR